MDTENARVTKYCERSAHREYYPLVLRGFAIIAMCALLFLFIRWALRLEGDPGDATAMWMMLKILAAFLGVAVLVLWIRAFVGMRAIHKTLLARDALLQTGLLGKENVPQAFHQINSDITANGKRYGPLYIGKEWILGDCRAIRPGNMRAYFLYQSKTGKGPGHEALYIVDQDGREQTFAGAKARPAYEGLSEHFPQLPHGDTPEALNDYRNWAQAQRAMAQQGTNAPYRA